MQRETLLNAGAFAPALPPNAALQHLAELAS
jgi:hypothetical protein